MKNTMKRMAILSLALLSGSAAWAQSCNTADRSVLLILDASGSMNARLPNGETRMAVAQRAIKGVAGFIPAQAQLSLRLYGAQSAASRKNCEDTHVGVPFGPAGASSGPIAATVDGAKAQGYTPIAYSLGQAANDFPADAKERVIVLVSDGKEIAGAIRWSLPRRSPPNASPFTPWASSSTPRRAGSSRPSRERLAAPISMRRWDRSCRTRSRRRSMPARSAWWRCRRSPNPGSCGRRPRPG